ncbi:hypothetical protein [Clostridium sp. HBUAS56017]|nr:hypothetical protein [Clostridium sp. HBUAS56017]
MSNNNTVSLEEMCLTQITIILERFPDKGKNVNIEFIEKHCKKDEVCTS